MLESAVADARRAEAEKLAENQPPQPETTGVAPRGQVLSDVLRDVRERINHMGDLIAAKDEINQAAAPEEPVVDVDTQIVDDDLEARRQRLSKK
jgi:hypothetical protein